VASIASTANPLAGSDLAAFVLAVEAGSIHGAGDALELTQSAVTKRIHSLEQRLGARVLERGRFGVRPTELGRALYPQAKQALASLDAVARVADISRGKGAMDLHLISSLTIGEFLLPGWLAQFRQLRPDIHPQLEIVNSRGVLDAIREGRQEIGFVEGADSLEGLQTLTVARDEIVVAVAATHHWAHRRKLRPSELTSEPYLTRESASGTRAVAHAALSQAGIELEPALQVASAQSLKRTLASGGFTLISRLAIEDEQRAGTLSGIPVSGLDLTRDLCAIARKRPPFTGAARALWRWLSTLPPASTELANAR
jgi:DNA-binding transcriptional LysR family regulator